MIAETGGKGLRSEGYYRGVDDELYADNGSQWTMGDNRDNRDNGIVMAIMLLCFLLRVHMVLRHFIHRVFESP